MHKALMGLLIVLAVLAGAVVAAVVFIDGERLRLAAIDYIERRDGVELEIDRVDRTVGLSPRIEVHGVRLRQPEFTDAPLLEIDYAAFKLDVLSFLLEPVTLRDVVVESPTVVLPVADEGLLYWGPVIADLMERLRRFEWAVHGFSITQLEAEALHTVQDARALLRVASLEGAMPHVADLTLRVKDVSGDLQAAVPLPIDGSLALQEVRLQHTDAELPVILEADGSIGSRPLRVRARSSNVLKDDPSARGTLDATIELGPSALRVNGTASRGGHPHFDLAVELTARDWTSIPSSDLRFRLSDDGLAWNIQGIEAAVADARAGGQLRIERRDPRPLLTGAVEVTGFSFAATESPSRPEIFRMAAERLDRLDAVLDVRAKDGKALGVPIKDVRAQLRLADGRLQIDPVAAEVLAGSADARLSLASNGDPPRFELMTKFAGVEAGDLAAALGVDHEVFGDLQGTLELSADDLENLAGGAAGSATLLMSGGRLSAALAQLVDMDFAERIVGSFRKKGETTPIRCAIADFEGAGGIFESRALIVDTGEVKLVGAGTINLAERTLDLVIRPYEKDFSLFSSDAPLRVSGTLSNPEVSPDKGAMVLSLLTPIEIGRTENEDCQAVIQWASDAMADSERRNAQRRRGR